MPETHTARQPRPRITLARCALVFGVVAVAMLIGTRFVKFNQIAGEFGLLECTQLGFWCLSAIVALAAAPSRKSKRDRWNCLWLGVIALLIAWRETDAHEKLNAEALGVWALHFRADWLTDASVPIHVKLAWGLVFAIVAALLVVPLIKAKPDGLKQLRRLDPGAIMFVLALGGIGFGYAADDLLGRGQFVPVATSKIFEESGELMGAVAFFLCVVASVSVPLDVREGRLSEPPQQ